MVAKRKIDKIDFTPALAFYFRVTIDGRTISFQSVSGLEAEIETDTVKEGGLNNETFQLPKSVKYPNIVMKRGLIKESNRKLLGWIKQQILSETNFEHFHTKAISVSLMNAENDVIMSWNIPNAYPVKWSISEFNAMKNEIVIESIEFAHSRFTIEDPK